jgi:hypothetical protein
MDGTQEMIRLYQTCQIEMPSVRYAKGSAGQTRIFGLGTDARKIASGDNWEHISLETRGKMEVLANRFIPAVLCSYHILLGQPAEIMKGGGVRTVFRYAEQATGRIW